MGLRQLPLRGGKGRLQLGLLGLKHVKRNCLRVRKPICDQAAAASFDLLNLALAPSGVLPLVLGKQAELLDQLGLDGGGTVGELRYLLLVIAGDFLLKPVGWEIWQIAARAPMPTAAHEVVVLAAVAGDLREQQSLAAEFAED